jgi:UDP-3-O-[3-hydroxymyristoyl] glucosamine N-acyltransferase
MKLSDINSILNGVLEGNPDKEISNIAKIEIATESEISFISNPVYAKYFYTTKAGALLISTDFEYFEKPENLSLIRVPDPYLAFLELIELFHKDSEKRTGISEKAYIGEGTTISEDVYIGPFSYIGNNCSIGKRSNIFPNCTIEKGVTIGDNVIIYPNVSVYNGSVIGNNVIIHSGAVIGSDGFGQAKQPDGTYKKIPQVGIVVIEDDVEIGSCTSIDRATIGETRICKGVKLDNQIQIAHNVIIGEHTVIAAHTGIAGSTKIGKRCMIGGKAGIAGHIEIGDDVILGAASNTTKSILKPGLYMGYRAKPMRDFLREEANVNSIPDLKTKIKNLESNAH